MNSMTQALAKMITKKVKAIPNYMKPNATQLSKERGADPNLLKKALEDKMKARFCAIAEKTGKTTQHGTHTVFDPLAEM
jgi:hypothetical protein